VSLIHEALRSGSSARGGARTAHADSVLRTLGYRRRPARGRQSLAVLLLAGLAAASYAAWTWARPAPEVVRHPTSRPAPSPRPAVTRPADVSVARVVDHRPFMPGKDVEPQSPLGATPPLTRAVARTTPEAKPKPVSQPSPEPPTIAAPVRIEGAAPPRDDFQLALYYQRAGDADRAQSQYRAVLARNPTNAEAHNNLGLLLKEAGQLDAAIDEFRRALAVNPQYVRALNNRAVTELAQGHVDRATADLESALAIDPDNVDALVNLALARKAAGQPDEAHTLLMRALAADPRSAPAHYNLAVQYDRAGDITRAVEHYRAFLRFAGANYTVQAADVRARLARLERGES
jgi:Tfp pilus assembly protein PilF